MYIYTYTLLYTFYVYAIVRENVYVAFLVLLWIFGALSSMTSINYGFFFGRKVSCAPNSCEARSQVSLFRIYQKSLFRFVVKRLIFGLFWLQISAEKNSNKNEHMFDYHIRVRIWWRALSSMTCSSLVMTHPRVKKRCFFFFTIIGEFLYDVPLQISENF